MKIFRSIIASVLALSALAGCQKEIQEVVLEIKKESYEVKVGEELDLSYEIKIENTDKAPSFSSSDEAVATVSAEGVVLAVAPGEAEITVSVADKTAKTTVVVPKIPADKIVLSGPETLLADGETWGKVTAVVEPEGYDYEHLSWEFSPSYPEFESEKVSASEYKIRFKTYQEGGYVQIKVYDTNSKKYQSLVVKASEKPAEGVTSLEVLPETLSIPLDSDPVTLTVNFEPVDYDVSLFEWTSSDENVAVVEAGVVTAVAEGETQVKVKDTVSGMEAACAVTVTGSMSDVAIKKIDLSKTLLEMEVGDPAFELKAKCYDEDGNLVENYSDLVWTAEQMVGPTGMIDVVTVTQQGVVTAKAVGTTIITVCDKKVSAVKATCDVVVKKKVNKIPVESVELNYSTIDLKINEKIRLQASIKPDNATLKAVTWTSSDASVVSVDPSGNITALKESAQAVDITAAVDGKSAVCKVTVSKVPVEEVSLNAKAWNMTVGDEFRITALVLPDNASYRHVTFASSDETVATVAADGTIKAVAEGQAKITATADGVSAECEIKVGPKASGVESITIIGPTTHSLNADPQKNVIKLTAVLNPEEATGMVNWESSDSQIAEVDGEGNVTIKKYVAGSDGCKVTITASCGGIREPHYITIYPLEVESVRIIAPAASLVKKQTMELGYEVTPANASVQSVYWSVPTGYENAAVSDKGVVTGRAVGEAVVRVVINGSASATVNLSVTGISPQSLALSDFTMQEGATIGFSDLQIGWNPSDCDFRTFACESSDPSVLAVGDGTLTALKSGEATLKVTTETGLTASCKVTVSGSTGLTFNLEIPDGTIASAGLPQLDKVQLRASYKLDGLPVLGTPSGAEWSSSDPSLATVSQTGVVTAVYDKLMDWEEEKVVTITHSVGTVQKSVDLRIIKAKPKEVVFTALPEDNSLMHGSQFTFEAKVLPEISGHTVTFMCSYGVGGIGFEDGSFTAKQVGNVTVTAYAYNPYKNGTTGVTRSISVNVKPIPVESFNIVGSDKLDLEIGDVTYIEAEVLPKNASFPTITWTSSPSAVVSVTQDGKVTALKAGEAVITGTLRDGKTVKYDVTVKTPQTPLAVGDFYYADGTTSSEYYDDMEVVGIVFSIKNPSLQDPEMDKSLKGGLVVALEDAPQTIWQSQNAGVSLWLAENGHEADMQSTKLTNGYSNTLAILAYNEENPDNKVLITDNAPDVQLPQTTSGWYVPSYAEMLMLKDNLAVVSEKIEAAGGSIDDGWKGDWNPAGYYWTSTEGGSVSQAMGVQMSPNSPVDKTTYPKQKSNSYKVRYIFAF